MIIWTDTNSRKMQTFISQALSEALGNHHKQGKFAFFTLQDFSEA